MTPEQHDAVVTPAMQGMPLNSGLAALQAAPALIARGRLPDLGTDFATAAKTIDWCANQAVAGVYREGANAQARSDATSAAASWRVAGTSLVAPAALWRSAEVVAARSDAEREAAMNVLRQHGLAGTDGELDLDAVSAESEFYAVDVAATGKQLANLGLESHVGGAMKTVRIAADLVATRVLEFRVCQDVEALEDAEGRQHANEEDSVLEQVMGFAMNFGASVASNGPSGAIQPMLDAAGTIMNADAANALKVEIDSLQKRISTTRRAAILTGLQTALDNLIAAASGVQSELGAMDRAQDEQGRAMANTGVDADEKLRRGGALNDDQESNAAMGTHMALVLRAHREAVVAQQAFAVVGTAIDAAYDKVGAAFDARATPAVAELARQGQQDALGPLDTTRQLNRLVMRRYAATAAKLAPAVAQVAREVGRLTPDGTPKKR